MKTDSIVLVRHGINLNDGSFTVLSVDLVFSRHTSQSGGAFGLQLKGVQCFVGAYAPCNPYSRLFHTISGIGDSKQDYGSMRFGLGSRCFRTTDNLGRVFTLLLVSRKLWNREQNVHRNLSVLT